MWHSRSNFTIAEVNTANYCCLTMERKKSAYPTKSVISNIIVVKLGLDKFMIYFVKCLTEIKKHNFCLTFVIQSISPVSGGIY